MHPSDLLALAVIGAVGLRLSGTARATLASRRRVLELVGGLRWRHVGLAVPVALVVLPTAVALLSIPGLDWGWWQAIGGAGNPVFAQNDGTERLGIGVVLVPLFVTLLVISLPLLVEREERLFRLGAERRSTVANLRRSLAFGLAHAVVGIPVGVALALSLGGAWLTEVYLRAWRSSRLRSVALAEATRVHLAYDLLIVALVVPLLLVGA